MSNSRFGEAGKRRYDFSKIKEAGLASGLLEQTDDGEAVFTEAGVLFFHSHIERYVTLRAVGQMLRYLYYYPENPPEIEAVEYSLQDHGVSPLEPTELEEDARADFFSGDISILSQGSIDAFSMSLRKQQVAHDEVKEDDDDEGS